MRRDEHKGKEVAQDTAGKSVPIAWSDEFEKVVQQHTFLINSKYGDVRELITSFFRDHLVK